jgi:hypothetical protein
MGKMRRQCRPRLWACPCHSKKGSKVNHATLTLSQAVDQLPNSCEVKRMNKKEEPQIKPSNTKSGSH